MAYCRTRLQSVLKKTSGWPRRLAPAVMGASCLLAPGWLPVVAARAADNAGPDTAQRAVKTAAMAPDEAWGPVMKAIALSGLYADGKTVVDLVPKQDPAKIMAAYRRATRQGPLSQQALATFVNQHFAPPKRPKARLSEARDTPINAHIRHLWPYLTRDPKAIPLSPHDSLIALPHRYVVPGGRFNEMFYWDSYFTMLGLAASDRLDLVRDMVDNFAWLIDTYGFVPNGTRTYFLTRSQPPFFAAMVALLARHDGPIVYHQYRHALQQEYDFWMAGAHDLKPGQARGHVVRLSDGTLLNRYHGGRDQPRAEAYAAELRTAAQGDRPKPIIYRNLRAAAESGWDFSSRWIADGQHLATTHAEDIVPVDLNALLVNLERNLAKAADADGDREQAKTYRDKARARTQAINRLMWDGQHGFYTDYDWRTDQRTDAVTAAMAYPLYFDIADDTQSARVAHTLRAQLLAPGGLLTTTIHSHQQWDAPNGWAPLQWIAIDGLARHGQPKLAYTIAKRWVATNRRVYDSNHKLVEKYNVEQPGLGGGGEYAVVDGFGWTNGVLLAIFARYPNLRPAHAP